MKKFKKTVNNAPSDKTLDKLWGDCIKARAGRKSEISGMEGVLHPHHIMQKPNHRLRWELSNGVCLTAGEHFNWHRLAKSSWDLDRKLADVQKVVFLKLRGTTEDNLLILKRQSGGVDKFGVKLYLELKIKEFEAENRMNS